MQRSYTPFEPLIERRQTAFRDGCATLLHIRNDRSFGKNPLSEIRTSFLVPLVTLAEGGHSQKVWKDYSGLVDQEGPIGVNSSPKSG
jgi:hypothetical protein